MNVKRVHIVKFMLVRISQFKEEEGDVKKKKKEKKSKGFGVSQALQSKVPSF